MRSDVDTIKEKLNIAEIISGYIKLEKAGQSLKARCPFHSEKTPSFFVSPSRQSFYCFGCGAKGDIFTFIEDIEGLDFRGALKLLADKAGVQLKLGEGESKEEKDKLLAVVEEATKFFEDKLKENQSALRYLVSRGINEESIKNWRLGYAPGPSSSGWRSLFDYLYSLGYSKGIILKAGLAKTSEASKSRDPYDVFRDRLIFPLADLNGKVIAFSGRALAKETEPKYLNSPDTPLFLKSEVLYGLDKAKEEIRKKDYTVLVEGQIDLVLSHQIGIGNTVAASGTAFTQAHLERMKRFSSRIIIAFDGDSAGEKAAERASELGIYLGMDVKIAYLPKALDPAEIIQKDPKMWKDILRRSLPAVEYFFERLEEREKDLRKKGQQIVKKILPMIKLMNSAIEQSHYISMLGKRTGIKEEVLWEDLKKAKQSEVTTSQKSSSLEIKLAKNVNPLSYREQIKERLEEIKIWKKELATSSSELDLLQKEEKELSGNLKGIELRDDLSALSYKLSEAEKKGDSNLAVKLTSEIQELHNQMGALEETRKML